VSYSSILIETLSHYPVIKKLKDNVKGYLKMREVLVDYVYLFTVLCIILFKNVDLLNTLP